MAETTLGINGLQPGFKYNVRVRGIFNGTPGPWSATEEFDVFSDTTNGTGDKSPSPPTAVTVTPTVDSFIITWIAPTTNGDGSTLKDMKEYVLEVRNGAFGTPDATYIIPEAQNPSILSAVDREHQFEFTYKMNRELYGTAQPTLYFRVWSRDTTNNRSATAGTPSPAATSNAAPAAPVTLTATAYAGGVNLQWSASTSNDTVEYVVQSHTASMANPPVTGTEIFRGNSLAFTHAVSTPTRYYRVGAVDIFGQTTWSNEQSATPGTITVTYNTPVDPTGFTNSYVGPNYRIGWTASASSATDIKHYKVDVTANGNLRTFYTTGTFIDIDPGAGRDFGSDWPYTATAATITTIGPSGLASTPGLAGSGFVTAPSTPAAPNIAAALGTTGERGINITWTAPSDPSGIVDAVEIYAGTTASPTTPVYTGNSTSYTFPVDPTYNGTYYFRARTKDKFGRYSAYSSPDDTVAVTTLGATTVGTVTGSLDTADPTNLTAMLNVTWTNPTSQNYDGTRLRYRLNGTTDWTILDVGRVTSTLIRNLVPGKTYNLEVIAYDFNGTLGNSGTWTAFANQTVTADSFAPSQPTAPTVAANTMQIQVTQAFTKQAGGALESDVKEFEVYAGTSAAPTTKIGTMPYLGGATTTVATFDIPASAASGSTQAWIVRTKAVDYTGNASAYSPDSSSANVNLISTTNIADATITNAKIGSVDAGKITTGTLDAARIGVYSTGANFIPIEYCGFENRPSTYTSLFANTNATTSVVTTQQRSGSQALQIVTSNVTTETYFAPTATSYNMVGTAGETYIVSMYIKSNSGTPTIKIRFKSSTGAVQNFTTAALTTGWVRYSAAFLAPASTTGFQIGVADLSIAGTVFIDDVMVEKAIGTGTTPSQFVSSTATVIDGNGILTGTVNANRLEAGSAIVGNLDVRSSLTVGTGGVAGEIKSGGYTAGVDGWRIGADTSGNTTLEINDGVIKADAVSTGTLSANVIGAGTIDATKLNVGGGVNLVDPAISSFELPNATYQSGGQLALTAISGTPTWATGTALEIHGAQSLVISTQAAISDQIIQLRAPYIPVVANKRYLISAYVYQNTGGARTVTLRGIGNVSAAADVTSGVTSVASSATVPTRVWGIWTAGASDTFASIQIKISNHAASVNTYTIDGVQFEEILSTTGVPTGPSAYSYPTGTVIDGAGIVTGSVTSTSIAASGITADKIQIGGTNVNLLPPQWSDFEFDSFYYVGKMDGQNATAGASNQITAKFNSQSCKVVTTSATNTIFFAVDGAQANYNFKVAPNTTYILSAYIYNDTGANRTISFRYRFGAGPTNTDVAATVDDPGGPNDGTTTIGAGAWYRIYATVTTGTETDAVLGLRNFNAAGTYYVDGVMVEKRVGNQSKPSPWIGAPQTVIDGGSISTSTLKTDRVNLGLFNSNILENGSFEKNGYIDRADRRLTAAASSVSIPGWTLARERGDANSEAYHEWGNSWSIDKNLAPSSNFEQDDGVYYGTCATSDAITYASHGLAAGDVITFKSFPAGTGLNYNTPYYVIASGLTADVFYVSATFGGTQVNLTVAGDVQYVRGTPSGWSVITPSGTHNGGLHITSGNSGSGNWKFGQTNKVTGYFLSNNVGCAILESPTPLVNNDYIDITNTGNTTINYSGTAKTVENAQPFRSINVLDFDWQTADSRALVSCEEDHGLFSGQLILLEGLDTETVTQADGYYLVEPHSTNAWQFYVTPTSTALACSFTIATDVVTMTNHGMISGDKIIFKSISGTTGINTSTTYYIYLVDENSFKLQLTYDAAGGSFVNLATANGTGTARLAARDPYSVTVKADGWNVVTYNKTASNVAFTSLSAPGTLTYGKAALLRTAGATTINAYNGMEYKHNITPGTVNSMALSFWYKVTGTARGRAYLGDSSNMGAATFSGDLTATTWTKVTMGYTPASGTSVVETEFQNFVTAANNSGDFYIDGVQLIVGVVGDLKEYDNFYTQAARSGLAKVVLRRSETTRAVTFQVAGNTVTLNGHGLANGDSVSFSSITNTTGISINTSYYVVGQTTNTFQLSLTSGGAAIDLTGTDGTGNMYSTGTTITSEPFRVTQNEEYALGLYYYGDMGVGVKHYIEYSASLPFSASATTNLDLNNSLLASSINSIEAKASLSSWTAKSTGYARLVVKNTCVGGTHASPGTLYLEDAWVVKKGATSGELTDAGIRLFDGTGKETVSLMSDSGDGGDFMQFGTGVYIDGASNSISASNVEVAESFKLGGQTIEDILRPYPRGIIARISRSVDSDTDGIAEKAFLELRAEGLEAGRLYKVCVSPIVAENTNDGGSRTDFRVRYNNTDPSAKPGVSDFEFGFWSVLTNNTVEQTSSPMFEKLLAPNAADVAVGGGTYRFLLSFQGAGTVGANTITMRPNGVAKRVAFWVEDIGLNFPESGAYRGTTDVAGAGKIVRKVLRPLWSAGYQQQGGLISSNHFGQGERLRGYGVETGAVRFPTGDIPAGARISQVRMYLNNYESSLASGVDVYVGLHKAGQSIPQTWTGVSATASGYREMFHFNRGSGTWVDITALSARTFGLNAWSSTGRPTGFYIGYTGMSTGSQYAGGFVGRSGYKPTVGPIVGRPVSNLYPRLEITYQEADN